MAYNQHQAYQPYNTGMPPPQPQWQPQQPQQPASQWQPPPAQPVHAPGQMGAPPMGVDSSMGSGLEAGQSAPEWNGLDPVALTKFGALGLGASAETMISASSNFAQQTYAKYLSGESLRYYFTVNQRYVIKRLQMLWCPFLFKGNWNRSHDQVVGGAAYRPPSQDSFAPDLYLPVMGFCSYCMLCCVADLFHKGVFEPERAGRYLWWASLAWMALVGVMWFALQSVAGNQGPAFLDACANAGYVFILVSGECALGFFSKHVYYAVFAWGTISFFLFLVKTLRRDLAGAARMGGGASKRKAAVLLVALSQAPVAFWLGRLPRS